MENFTASHFFPFVGKEIAPSSSLVELWLLYAVMKVFFLLFCI